MHMGHGRGETPSFKVFHSFIYMSMCGYAYTTMVLVERSEDNLQKSVPFYHVGPGIEFRLSDLAARTFIH